MTTTLDVSHHPLPTPPTDESTTQPSHPTPTPTPSPSPSPSSALPTILQRHQSLLARLTSLERRLASRVAHHRRRAVNLLEETPRYRRTHARIFVSHRLMDEKEVEVEMEEEEEEVEEERRNEGPDEGQDVDRRGEDTEKKEKEKGDHGNNRKDGTSPSAIVARGGGKDFQTLLHSAAAHREGSDGDVEAARKTNNEKEKETTEEEQDKRETSPAQNENEKENAAPKRKWTLVIEGGLLVGNLDHESARDVDRRLEGGLPVLGGVGSDDGRIGETHSGKDERMDGKGNGTSQEAVADADDGDIDGDGTPAANTNTANTNNTVTTARATIPLRDQWRGGVTEREGEWNVEPLTFTHLFDRLEVEFRTTSGEETTTKTVTWDRRRDGTPDARAFFVSMTEWGKWETIDPDEGDAGNGTEDDKAATLSTRTKHNKKKRRAVYDDKTYINAVVKLYPRLPDSSGQKDVNDNDNHHDDDDDDDDDDNNNNNNNNNNDTSIKGHDYNDSQTYLPSTEMCRVFFPTFLGEMAHEMKRREMQRAQSGGKKSGKKRKRSLESADSAALKAMRKEGGSASASGSGAVADATATASSSSAAAAANATAATTSSSTTVAIPPTTSTSTSNATSLQQQPRTTSQPTPKEEKDVTLPHTLTMDEALSTLFYYIRTRHLQDPTDLSIVNNDETLTRLFGCPRMLLSAARGLLLQRGLLVKVTNDGGGKKRRDGVMGGTKGGTQEPVVLRYRMTKEGAEPLARKGGGGGDGEGGERSSERSSSASEAAAGSSINTRRRVLNDKDNDDGNNLAQQSLSRQETDASKPNVIHANTATTSSSSSSTQQRRQPTTPTPPTPPPYHQTILSCDIDVTIPSLLQPRLRDILRRTKYREFEYTSSRNKANKYLVATKVEEETAKTVLEDVVTGKGYMPHHRWAWMALARGSHRGGEAERAAWIDLRTVALMEGVEERCAVVRGLWGVVEACRGL